MVHLLTTPPLSTARDARGAGVDGVSPPAGGECRGDTLTFCCARHCPVGLLAPMLRRLAAGRTIILKPRRQAEEAPCLRDQHQAQCEGGV